MKRGETGMGRLTSTGMKGVQKFTPPGSHLDLSGMLFALLGFLLSSSRQCSDSF